LAKVTQNDLHLYPRPSGEQNFYAKHRWVTPNDQFLLPDNGVFKIATKVFNRGKNRFGYDTLQSIKKMDNKVFPRGFSIGEAEDEVRVRHKPRKDWTRHNIHSYSRKHMIRIMKILGLDKYSKPERGFALENLIELSEHLAADASVKDYIDDFQGSKNSKFAGKSPEKRRKMAIAAWYAKNEAVDEGEVVDLTSHPKYKNKRPLYKMHGENSRKINTLDFARRHGYKLSKPKVVGELEITEISKGKLFDYLKKSTPSVPSEDRRKEGRNLAKDKLGFGTHRPKVRAESEDLGDYSCAPEQTDHDEDDVKKHSIEVLKARIAGSNKTYNGEEVDGEETCHSFNSSSQEVNSHNARKQEEDKAIPEGFYNNGIRVNPRTYSAGKAKKVSNYLSKQKAQIGKDMKNGG